MPRDHNVQSLIVTHPRLGIARLYDGEGLVAYRLCIYISSSYICGSSSSSSSFLSLVYSIHTAIP